MADSTLRYVAGDIDGLEVGQCTVRRCRYTDGEAWRLWFRVVDEVGSDAGAIVVLSVGLRVGGDPVEGNAATRRWGFKRVAPGTWQVAPSIDVAETWHHTPLVVGAPEPAPWDGYYLIERTDHGHAEWAAPSDDGGGTGWTTNVQIADRYTSAEEAELVAEQLRTRYMLRLIVTGHLDSPVTPVT